MLEGTLAIDERGDVRMCSDALAVLLGRPAASMIGRPVWSLLPGWIPFRAPSARRHASLMVAGAARVPVELASHMVHMPGGALFVIEVFSRSGTGRENA